MGLDCARDWGNAELSCGASLSVGCTKTEVHVRHQHERGIASPESTTYRVRCGWNDVRHRDKPFVTAHWRDVYGNAEVSRSPTPLRDPDSVGAAASFHDTCVPPSVL